MSDQKIWNVTGKYEGATITYVKPELREQKKNGGCGE
jgi:hypothetical protein